MPKPFTVKVQYPLAGDKSNILIYNFDKTLSCMFPYTPDLHKLVNRKQPKAYCKASMLNGMLILHDVVPDPGW